MTAKPFSRGANINIISYDMLVKVSKAAGDINFRVLIAVGDDLVIDQNPVIVQFFFFFFLG